MPGAGRLTKRAQNWRKMWGELFANVIEIEPPNAATPPLASRPTGDDDTTEDAVQDGAPESQVNHDKGNNMFTILHSHGFEIGG